MTTGLTVREDVKDAILLELDARPRRPTDLLDKLAEQFADTEVKAALLFLMHEGSIELTSERLLQRKREAA